MGTTAGSGEPTDAGEPPGAGAGAVPDGSTQPPWRAVVVDDHPDIRELLRLQLDRSPRISVVGVASDGVEAISAVERLQPDVVLLDLGLPQLSGIEAIPRLREVAPTAKIIAISGFEEGSQARAAREAGVDAYVEKGLSMQLVDVIDEVMGREG